MATRHDTGSCQCGAVAFQVEADLDETFACNCSRCRRMGFVLTFVPRAALVFDRDGPTTGYLFNTQAISHRFCPTCGVEANVFGERDGQRMAAINCLDGVDVRALNSIPVDGAPF